MLIYSTQKHRNIYCLFKSNRSFLKQISPASFRILSLPVNFSRKNWSFWSNLKTSGQNYSTIDLLNGYWFNPVFKKRRRWTLWIYINDLLIFYLLTSKAKHGLVARERTRQHFWEKESLQKLVFLNTESPFWFALPSNQWPSQKPIDSDPSGNRLNLLTPWAGRIDHKKYFFLLRLAYYTSMLIKYKAEKNFKRGTW